VSYRVEFAATADVQLVGLPDDAFAALVDALVKVVRDPWGQSGQESPDDDPAYRWLAFGTGLGVVLFYLDEPQRIVRVYDVTWIG
jgi:hypothetical protein